MCVRVCNNYPMHDAITFLQKQHADMMLRYLREKMSKARDKLNEQQAEEVNVSAYYCCMQKKFFKQNTYRLFCRVNYR